MDWRPSADERRAIRSASRSLHLDPNWIWYQDLHQAALIRLWKTAEQRATRYAHADVYPIAYSYARHAMLNEWHRIIERMEGKAHEPGPPVQFVSEPEKHMLFCPDEADGPELIAERAEQIRLAASLPEPLADALAARLMHDGKTEAARALRITVSCYDARVVAARRAMAKVQAGQPHGWREEVCRPAKTVPN